MIIKLYRIIHTGKQVINNMLYMYMQIHHWQKCHYWSIVFLYKIVKPIFSTYWCNISRIISAKVFVMIFYIKAQAEEYIIPQKHLHSATRKEYYKPTCVSKKNRRLSILLQIHTCIFILDVIFKQFLLY